MLKDIEVLTREDGKTFMVQKVIAGPNEAGDLIGYQTVPRKGDGSLIHNTNEIDRFKTLAQAREQITGQAHPEPKPKINGSA